MLHACGVVQVWITSTRPPTMRTAPSILRRVRTRTAPTQLASWRLHKFPGTGVANALIKYMLAMMHDNVDIL